MQRSRTPSWDPSAERGSVPGSTKKLLKRNGTETPHLEITAVNTQSTALAKPGALVVHGAVSHSLSALTPHSLSHSYLLFSLLCANESRLSTAGRALTIPSQPRWQSLAKLVGKSKKKRWEALAEPGAVCA